MNDLPSYANEPDAIVTASYDGREDLVRYLISSGISPDTIDENGDTGLHAAAREGNSVIECKKRGRESYCYPEFFEKQRRADRLFSERQCHDSESRGKGRPLRRY